jgi:hypothetical protein
MELFAITGILALSLIFALLAALAALNLILFLMVRYNAATGSSAFVTAFSGGVGGGWFVSSFGEWRNDRDPSHELRIGAGIIKWDDEC